MFFFNAPIPIELVQHAETDEDIHILVGENGSGKSTLLGNIARYYSSKRVSVIAIANTIYDKFPTGNNIHLQKAAYGKMLAHKIIKESILLLAEDQELKKLNAVAGTLRYIGFDPVIGVDIKGMPENFRDRLIASGLDPREKEDLLHFLNRFVDRDTRDQRVYLQLDGYAFKKLRNAFILQVFFYEKKLRQLKLITGIELFLQRRGEDIALLKASSGEITLATTLIYITSVIHPGSVILIDEPENSLHPKWQTEYVRQLSELFYFYQPKIIIATHSPLILNGAEVFSKSIQVYKGVAGEFTPQKMIGKNVEAVYQDYFDVTTPENRFVSEEIVEQMNLLSEKKITQEQFEHFIHELINNSYDEQQKTALNDILALGKKVIEEN